MLNMFEEVASLAFKPQNADTSEAHEPDLEAIQGNKQPQNVIGALEDAEDSQISHHSLHSSILQKHHKLS